MDEDYDHDDNDDDNPSAMLCADMEWEECNVIDCEDGLIDEYHDDPINYVGDDVLHIGCDGRLLKL